MATFTIFTGTYNSEKVIHRVFKSVEQQTLRDFEWIVIDDCSKDSTVGLIEDFRDSHSELAIRIFKHAVNSGVAVSRKEALDYTDGKYFITWDHDDIQHPLQLDTYLALWRTYDNNDVANIFAKVTDQNGKLLGNKFPTDGYVSDYISMHNDYLVGNKDAGHIVEHHVCCKTEKYLEVIAFYDENRNLLAGRYPNGADVWGMMAYLGYKTIYSNTPVRTYYINEEGRLSMSSRKRKDGADKIFRNKLLWVNLFDTTLSLKEYKWKLRNVFAVMMYGLLANRSLWEILRLINDGVKRFIGLCVYLPAQFLAWKFKRQE